MGLSPDLPAAHYDLGVALLNKGNLDRAIAEFHEVLRLAPGFAEGHYDLGITLAAAGKKDEVAREFAEAQRLDPKLKPPTNSPHP